MWYFQLKGEGESRRVRGGGFCAAFSAARWTERGREIENPESLLAVMLFAATVPVV